MRYKIAAVCLLLVVLSMSVSAEFVRATRFVSNQPERQYPASPCTMVESSEKSPTCYRDGIAACRKLNSVKCFSDCARKVRSDCVDAVRKVECELPAGWEFKFRTRQACLVDANKECGRICWLSKAAADCRRQAYSRCSYIGRIFV